jgi:hypothetical protein
MIRISMLELDRAGLLAEAGLEQVGDDGFAMATGGRARGGWVEAVEDEEVAFGVVHGGERGDALEVVHGSESIHLVVVHLIPGDVPTGVVSPDADGEFHGAKVVADGRKASHERQI